VSWSQEHLKPNSEVPLVAGHLSALFLFLLQLVLELPQNQPTHEIVQQQFHPKSLPSTYDLSNMYSRRHSSQAFGSNGTTHIPLKFVHIICYYRMANGGFVNCTHGHPLKTRNNKLFSIRLPSLTCLHVYVF